MTWVRAAPSSTISGRKDDAAERLGRETLSLPAHPRLNLTEVTTALVQCLYGKYIDRFGRYATAFYLKKLRPVLGSVGVDDVFSAV